MAKPVRNTVSRSPGLGGRIDGSRAPLRDGSRRANSCWQNQQRALAASRTPIIPAPRDSSGLLGRQARGRLCKCAGRKGSDAVPSGQASWVACVTLRWSSPGRPVGCDAMPWSQPVFIDDATLDPSGRATTTHPREGSPVAAPAWKRGLVLHCRLPRPASRDDRDGAGKSGGEERTACATSLHVRSRRRTPGWAA